MLHTYGENTLVPTNNGPQRYIGLDNAATTPPLRSVKRAVDELLPWYGSIHRGGGLKSRLSSELYEQARQTALQFVGARSDEHVVIFGRNTTDAINLLSRRLTLRKSDIVLISPLEHHSNDLPWRKRATTRRIKMTADGRIDRDDFLYNLEHYGNQIKLVAMTGASNVTGYVPDIHWFARHAHSAGARILIDAAQLAAHRPIDMKVIDDPEHLDYVALSGHKLYAPFGSGALIGRRDTFDTGEPDYRGGGTVRLVTPQTVDWALPPEKEEAGTPNTIGAVAMARAMKSLRGYGYDRIVQHEAVLVAYALTQLATIPAVRIYGNYDLADRIGVIAFEMQDVPHRLVAATLDYEWGIGVRSGCFCAQPFVMDLLNVSLKAQKRLRAEVLHSRYDHLPGLVRISCGIHTTPSDIDRLIAGLRCIAAGQYGHYLCDPASGDYLPAIGARHLSHYFSI